MALLERTLASPSGATPKWYGLVSSTCARPRGEFSTTGRSAATSRAWAIGSWPTLMDRVLMGSRGSWTVVTTAGRCSAGEGVLAGEFDRADNVAVCARTAAWSTGSGEMGSGGTGWLAAVQLATLGATKVLTATPPWGIGAPARAGDGALAVPASGAGAWSGRPVSRTCICSSCSAWFLRIAA